jgi:hypothetical protein
LESTRYVYAKPPPNLKPSLCTTCLHLEATNVCTWYIVVVLGTCTLDKVWCNDFFSFLSFSSIKSQNMSIGYNHWKRALNEWLQKNSFNIVHIFISKLAIFLFASTIRRECYGEFIHGLVIFISFFDSNRSLNRGHKPDRRTRLERSNNIT